MKRFVIIVFIIVTLFSSVYAEGIDYSELSIDELQMIITEARNAIVAKTAHSEGKLFLIDEADGVQLYITGKGDYNILDQYALEAVVVNNTDKKITVGCSSVAINGWEVGILMAGITDVGAGKKKKDALALSIANADISSYTEIEEVELSLYIFDSDEYEIIKEYEPITIYFDGTDWFK